MYLCIFIFLGTPVDFGDDFDVIEDGHDRRMTFELLDYLPPITEDVEESNSNCKSSFNILKTESIFNIL